MNSIALGRYVSLDEVYLDLITPQKPVTTRLQMLITDPKGTTHARSIALPTEQDVATTPLSALFDAIKFN